jgi:DNA primase
MERIDRDRQVEQVREATDIVELIGSYLDLRPAGRGFKARCPFHKERTPSFVVSSERQLFHCFGCGAGGDAFSFVMKHDGLEFAEALQLLARRAGIELRPLGPEKGPDRAALIAALREAVRFYRGQLRAPTGSAALEYLKRRSLPGRLLDLFYVGFAPPGGQAFLEYASPRFPREVLVQAGLVGQDDGGRLYDRFRARIVIPILASAGDPIGFGARTIQEGVEPKYLNSPETPVYKKSRILFGVPQARQAFRTAGSALVVEGYFDVIGLAAGGIHNAVAPCGTALTPEHVRLLAKVVKRIILLFDGDPAGRNAAWRALATTLAHHADVGVAVLPAGKDPDDLVREGRLSELHALIDTPRSPVAFAIETLAEQGLEGHGLIGRLAETLAAVGNPVARELMVDEAAERSRLPARILRREVERLGRAGLAFRGETTPDASGGGVVGRLTPLEEAVLRVVLAEPAAAGPLLEAATGVASIRTPVRNVTAWAGDRSRAGSPPSAPELLRRVQSELGQEIPAGFLLDDGLPAPDEEYRQDLTRRLREQGLEAELEAVGYQIRALEREGKGAELEAMLLRKHTIAKDLARSRGARPDAKA